MGFINGKKICVGIGQCLYYCKVVKILINGKILVTYKNNDYIYSFRDLKIMTNNGKYIIERDEKRRRNKEPRFSSTRNYIIYTCAKY